MDRYQLTLVRVDEFKRQLPVEQVDLLIDSASPHAKVTFLRYALDLWYAMRRHAP
jgi:hypothetical protein